MNKYFIIIGLVFFILLVPNARAEQIFNPNFIIGDHDILNYQTMTALEIQRFLESKHSYLANFSVVDNLGNNIKASDAIYQVAINARVNPRFILVLLQKEQSLVEEASPSVRSLDWATGYGCPDGASCNVRWQGFYKQINSASLQFRDYMDNPQLYTYRKGNTYLFKNPYSTLKQEMTSVTPLNDATAALYNYTPHVYNGNYNFWKIWNRYFSRTGYPSGTLIRAKGEAGIWLIQNGAKRPFLSKGAFSSRFDFKKVIDVNKEDLSNYPTGPAIKYPQYSIVRSPAGALFLLVDDKRRPFADNEAFRKIGYNPEEVLNASWDDINSYQEAKPVTAEEAYPIGALLQDKTSGAVFWINEGQKQPIIDPLILANRFKGKKPVPVSTDKLNSYPTGTPVLLANGELVKIQNGFTIYVTEDTILRPIKSMTIFNSLGYNLANIIPINVKVFKLYQEGEPIE
jgi:hypothetical protein